MARSPEQQKMQEQALLNHIKRLERSGSDYLAVQIHLSRLIDLDRLPECLNVAQTMVARVAKTNDASLFDLFNNDLFLVYHRDSATQIDAAMKRLCRILKEDPFFASEPCAKAAFYRHFDLGDEYQEVLNRAQSLVEAREKQDAAHADKRTKPKHSPITLTDLVAVEKAITQADLSTMTSRQAVCEMDENGRPQPLFYELFTSMTSLRDTLLPGQDIFSDPWLFQYLTTKLDQRMLAWLGKNDDATLKHSFSLNINIASLLSPRFLELDEQLDRQRRNTIIIELQMQDIYADVTRYLFVREYLLDRGYRICLDGITETSLPYVNRKELGAELLKLQWSKSLRSQIEGKNRSSLRDALERVDPKRVILSRCESDDAIELGGKLGIWLFQGYYLDDLLSEKITREEASERLGAALTRHRRAAAPANMAVSS